MGPWADPDLGTLYLVYDEDGLPYAICTYLDLVIVIEDVDDEALLRRGRRHAALGIRCLASWPYRRTART